MFVMFAFALAMTLGPPASAAPPPAEEVKVVAVTASSTMPKWKGYTFDAENLIDGRVDTSWQPAKRDAIGVGEWVELDLGAPYELDHVDIAQSLQKVDPKLGDLFCRNNRFGWAYLLFDDGTYSWHRADPPDRDTSVGLFYRGEDLPGKEVRVVTRFIRLVVTSVLEPVDWKDLAIAEIRVFGRPAAAPPIDPVSIAWDQPGSYPFKAAVSEFCAVKLALRKQRQCGLLIGTVARGFAFHQGYTTLPPIAVADRDQGKVGVNFMADRMRVSLEFTRDAHQKWSVSSATFRDASGKPAPPAYTELFEEDRQHTNDCWEKLGKKRPNYPPEDYEHE